MIGLGYCYPLSFKAGILVHFWEHVEPSQHKLLAHLFHLPHIAREGHTEAAYKVFATAALGDRLGD